MILRQAAIYCLVVWSVLMAGCASQSGSKYPPMVLAEYVDLERFMGTWYVHGYTPTLIDAQAFNATETYKRGENGRVLTTYRFNADSIDGPEKSYTPSARVVNTTTNAEWRMRFFGIISAAYLILYVSDDYEYTVIGHPDRDLAWIMSRRPKIDEMRYTELRDELEQRSFDLSKFRRVEHGTAP